jgi:hypothetical protein
MFPRKRQFDEARLLCNYQQADNNSLFKYTGWHILEKVKLFVTSL